MPLAVLAALILAGPQSDLSDLSRRYGVTIDIRKAAFTDQADRYVVSGATAVDARLNTYVPLFIKEWSVYPPKLMKDVGVKSIVIAERIRVDTQFRAAVPAFDLDAMYYDAALGADRQSYQRSVIHHEFFHMIDNQMNLLYVDPEWASLNPEGFKYGSGGSRMRNKGAGDLTFEIPGFLTAYGTAAVEEDKAELFAKLIVEPTFVRERADADPVLARKIRLLKKRLADFNPHMGEEFWEDVARYRPVSG